VPSFLCLTFYICESHSLLLFELPACSFLFALKIVVPGARILSLFFEIRPLLFRQIVAFGCLFNQFNARIVLSRTWIFRIHLEELLFLHSFTDRVTWSLIKNIYLIIFVLQWGWSFLVIIFHKI
jgi:hypothetical protein